MSRGGTASNERLSEHRVPELVRSAVARAEHLGFASCVRPEIGRLLAILAAGLPAGSLVGETGTGTGAGLAWMVSACDPAVRFISYEVDPERAEAAEHLFGQHRNVQVISGDCSELFTCGPFDLLIHDGGPGSGKTPGSAAVDPAGVLRPGGTMTIDDYTPTVSWPPMFDGEIDESRVHWVLHPALISTEIRVAPDVAVVVCRYLPS